MACDQIMLNTNQTLQRLYYLISMLVLGENDLITLKKEIEMKVVKILVHPSYNDKPSDNDIAILELDSPIPMRKGDHS